MKLQTIFEYRDYKKFLNDYIRSRPRNGHGEKSRISAAIRCHSAYLSQTLHGNADLSAEQAVALCQYLNFNPEETDQFLLLVQLSRAGSQDLRKHLLKKLEQIEAHRAVLKNRIQSKRRLPKEDQATYFSAWHYSVIHLMVSTLQGFQTQERLESALTLPTKTIRQALQFLEESGLIERNGHEYKAGPVDIHLNADDSMINVHHTHWRTLALRALEHRQPDDLHYSSAVTVSESDYKAIRENLIQTIEKTRETISKTKPERVAVLTMDWFDLLKK